MEESIRANVRWGAFVRSWNRVDLTGFDLARRGASFRGMINLPRRAESRDSLTWVSEWAE